MGCLIAWVCLSFAVCLFHLPSLPPSTQPSSSNKLNEDTTTMTMRRHDAKVKPSLSLLRSTLEGQLLLCVSVGLKSWQRSRIRMRTREGGSCSVQAEQSFLEFNQSTLLLILLCISFRCCLTTSTCYARRPSALPFSIQGAVWSDPRSPLPSHVSHSQLISWLANADEVHQRR